MNESMKIQMDIKNNAQDLQNYALDLKNWEKEMKKKELELSKNNPPNLEYPPPRNKIKRNKNSENEKTTVRSKAKKISGYDYSAWDKYDVDKACAELDDEENTHNLDHEEQNLNSGRSHGDGDDGGGDMSHKGSSEDDADDEDKLSLIDQAVYEKELGNQHVRKEQWNEAINCYTKAIKLDSKNPIYYANRSLCFLKLKNFRASEVDATTALQLDKNYIKAYQRRGYARLALGQLAEAKTDFEEVLKMEPKNSLMSLEISKINDKLKKELNTIQTKSTFNHKKIFKNEVKKEEKRNSVSRDNNNKSEEQRKKDIKKTVNVIPKSPEVKAENLPSESKIPEENLNKGDGDKKTEKLHSLSPSVFRELPPHCKIVHPIQVPPHKRSKKPLKRIPIVEVFTEPDLDGSGDASGSLVSNKSKWTSDPVIKDVLINKYADEENYSLNTPKTSVQFQNNWKIIKKHPDDAWKYLKKLAEKLPEILDNSLESDLFSDLIKFLSSEHPEKESNTVYTLLLNLSKVKRFTSMTMFMSGSDKDCCRKCIAELKDAKSDSEITQLLSLYELL